MLTRYQRNRLARQADNERRLMGESLAAFHARETARPPTLRQIYCENHKNRERCRATGDLLSWEPPPTCLEERKRFRRKMKKAYRENRSPT